MADESSERNGEHGGKEHGPINPELRDTDPDEADEGRLVGGGGPAATLRGGDVESEDDARDRPDSAV